MIRKGIEVGAHLVGIKVVTGVLRWNLVRKCSKKQESKFKQEYVSRWRSSELQFQIEIKYERVIEWLPNLLLNRSHQTEGKPHILSQFTFGNEYSLIKKMLYMFNKPTKKSLPPLVSFGLQPKYLKSDQSPTLQLIIYKISIKKYVTHRYP